MQIDYQKFLEELLYLKWNVVEVRANRWEYETELAIWNHLFQNTTDDFCTCNNQYDVIGRYVSFKSRTDALVFKLAFG